MILERVIPFLIDELRDAWQVVKFVFVAMSVLPLVGAVAGLFLPRALAICVVAVGLVIALRGSVARPRRRTLSALYQRDLFMAVAVSVLTALGLPLLIVAIAKSLIQAAAMWLLLAVALVGGLALLVLMGHRNEQEARWELLSPKGARVLRGITSQVRGQLDLANLTYEEAFAIRELGSVEEAKDLLEAGYKVLEHFCPNMFRLLAAMSTFSRMVSAMAPIPPLRPARFDSPQISALANLHRMLHQLLVSSNERFRLRTYILGRSFALASRVLMRSTQRIVRGHADAERELQQVQAIRADMSTLSDETLESLGNAMASIAAVESKYVRA